MLTEKYSINLVNISCSVYACSLFISNIYQQFVALTSHSTKLFPTNFQQFFQINSAIILHNLSLFLSSWNYLIANSLLRQSNYFHYLPPGLEVFLNKTLEKS